MRFTCAFFCLAALAGGCTPPADHRAPAADTILHVPPALPVVRTWADLLAQKPIALSDGVTARLGIQATEVPQWSGALIYCLTENYAPPHEWATKHPDQGKPVGPVRVRLRSIGQLGVAGDLSKCALAQMFRDEDYKQSKLLFAHAVHIGRTEQYRLSILTEKGEELATATIKGTPAPYHPWMPWVDSQPLNTLSKVGAAGIALPPWPEMVPLVFEGTLGGKTFKRPADGPLPTLVPDEPDPGFRLAVTGDRLTITSDKDFPISRPGMWFLTRWWVGGKPFMPKQLDEFWGFSYSGRIEYAKVLTRRLDDLDIAKLGARKGDRIGLQLLYCPNGWDWVGGALMAKVAPCEPDGGPPMVRMTNRVEFIAP